MIEEVRGTVIGSFYRRYEFWTIEDPRCLAKKWFVSDDEAEQWFKENYPEHYKNGVEMRCWD